MHSPSVLLRDVRNIRKNNTLLLSMTSKDIGSTKDLKKARSSEQLINLKGFLDNKNDKIKTIDQKLQVHQTEIEKNGAIIEELTNTLLLLKNQFALEKEKVQTEEKKNKQLRQQIQRTNKLLKSKNFRIDELSKKIQVVEKQLEVLRPFQGKVEELTRANSLLRKQMAKLEQNLIDKKLTISQHIKQLQKLKEKISQLGGLKSENEKLKIQGRQKDAEIDKLHAQAKMHQNQNFHARSKADEKFIKLNEQVSLLKQKIKEKQALFNDSRASQKRQQQKYLIMEAQQKMLKSQIAQKNRVSQNLRSEVKQLKQKLESQNLSILEGQKSQNQKFLVLKSKLEQVQKKLDMEISEKLKKKPCEQKLENLSKKSKRLEELYRLMVPQIQCPYGHELRNPITVIPCGHNYCLECKKGYSKECMLCNGKLKIEAVYRNELMDDIINIVTGIKQILEMLK